MNEFRNNFIVFYDGECGFCNSTVQFILDNEKKDEILFTALQSDFTIDFLKSINFPSPDFSTLYFWSNGKLLKKSTAALAISKHLKKKYSWLRIFKIIPLPVRDFAYDFIAKHREKIKNDACFLPSENQRKRFLK
jgi:predicted DCC family thiol-disulfide oxidoreductase YuxK